MMQSGVEKNHGTGNGLVWMQVGDLMGYLTREVVWK